MTQIRTGAGWENGPPTHLNVNGAPSGWQVPGRWRVCTGRNLVTPPPGGGDPYYEAVFEIWRDLIAPPTAPPSSFSAFDPDFSGPNPPAVIDYQRFTRLILPNRSLEEVGLKYRRQIWYFQSGSPNPALDLLATVPLRDPGGGNTVQHDVNWQVILGGQAGPHDYNITAWSRLVNHSGLVSEWQVIGPVRVYW